MSQRASVRTTAENIWAIRGNTWSTDEYVQMLKMIGYADDLAMICDTVRLFTDRKVNERAIVAAWLGSTNINDSVVVAPKQAKDPNFGPCECSQCMP